VLILIFLFFGYSDLIFGIANTLPVQGFLFCYLMIHVTFTIWDLFLISRQDRRWPVVTYDFFGCLISGSALLSGKHSVGIALAVLWTTTVAYVAVAGLPILRKLNVPDEVRTLKARHR
jgi:hypothetical protein